MRFIYRVHAIQRMFQRDISEDDIENTIKNGEIIEKYLDDKPYSSFLILGFENNNIKKPLHIVFAKNDDNYIVITAYRPDASQWKDNYKTRITR